MKCLQILFPWFLLLCLMTRCLSQEEEFIYQLGDNISSVETHEETEEVEGIEIAAWNFDYVQGPLIITVFVIVAGIAKIGFHHAGILSSIFPESCSLIVLGSVVGGILYAMGAQHYLSFSAKTFFLLLLPPCVLESAYSLYDRTFIDNLGKILLYAVVGTLLNCFLIGPSLYACSLAGIMGASFEISLIECLVFSALIVAVDPVAVLAIFQEIHVNNVLYFLVFGESLLNDAVTIVLYNMMVAFVDMPTIPPSQIGYGVAAFFVVSIGGLIVGFVCGLFSAFMTKYTTQVRGTVIFFFLTL
uniref:Na(+)/H(+) exchanger protein 7-like n=1 Tax=Saccoglossus kowalevskii TaxID=10224 RepID=A0ABM0MHV2_SACKO|nr:PREDICTED: Na(+)/H(+) exchanger protein 7-like [Saccoglossus kowalevskii]